jgi:hypothetical protein
MNKKLLELTMSIFSRPKITFSDFYYAIHDNYFDIMYSKSEKIEKDYSDKDNFFYENVYSVMPKSRIWIKNSNLSSEYHWIQNIETTLPMGLVELVVFCPFLYKLPIFQDKIQPEMPYVTKYMIGFYGKPKPWKIKTSIFAVQNSRPYFDVHLDGVFYIDLKDNNIHYLSIDYDQNEMNNMKNRIIQWKRYHTLYEEQYKEDLCLFPTWAYPHFTNTKDDVYPKKIKFAKELGEISQLYYCKEKVRKQCHENNIFSYHDERFLPFLKTIQTDKKYEIIKRIVDAQKKNDNSWYIIDKKIEDDDNFKKLLQSKKIYYMDFETDNDQNIYLIGILSYEGEIISLWESPIEKFEKFLEDNKDAIFVYYCAEKTQMKRWLKKKYNLTNDEGENWINKNTTNWIDLNPILSNYCAFKDSFDFKLKSIQKAFSNHGVITESYSDDCANGKDSLDVYREYSETQNDDLKKNLIYYNYLDCLFTKNIAEFIYTHH